MYPGSFGLATSSVSVCVVNYHNTLGRSIRAQCSIRIRSHPWVIIHSLVQAIIYNLAISVWPFQLGLITGNTVKLVLRDHWHDTIRLQGQRMVGPTFQCNRTVTKDHLS